MVCLDQGLKISLQNVLNVMKKISKYITGNLNAAQKNPKNHEKTKIHRKSLEFWKIGKYKRMAATLMS